MLTSEEWMDIKLLKAEGLSMREIARRTGHSRNTVKRVLTEPAPRPFKAPDRGSKLDPFKPYIRQRYEQYGLSAVRLLEEVRVQGYGGSIYTLRRFLHSLKAGDRALERATVRFETPPGEQAQVDWTYCGRFADRTGHLIPVYGFALVLSFSRMLFCSFTTSMRIETLIACHLDAFEYLGGCPRKILYDNMKQVRLSASQLNPLFVDFASYYGVSVSTHTPRRPRTKGKIERAFAYVKDSFLAGRTFADLDELNAEARVWLETVANVRVHGTTKARPVDLLAREGLASTAQIARYRVVDRATRTVDAEGFVRYGRSRYSVPPEHVGRLVVVESDAGAIRVRCDQLVIAEHQAATKPGSSVVEPAHVEAMWKLSLGAQAPRPPRWCVRFDQGVAARPLTDYEEVAR
jgi:transposase